MMQPPIKGSFKLGENTGVKVVQGVNIEEIQKQLEKDLKEQQAIHMKAREFQFGIESDIDELTKHHLNDLNELERQKFMAYLAKQNELRAKQKLAENNRNIRMVKIQMSNEDSQNAVKIKQNILKQLELQGLEIHQETLNEAEIIKLVEGIKNPSQDKKTKQVLLENFKIKIEKAEKDVGDDHKIIGDILSTGFGMKLEDILMKQKDDSFYNGQIVHVEYAQGKQKQMHFVQDPIVHTEYAQGKQKQMHFVQDPIVHTEYAQGKQMEMHFVQDPIVHVEYKQEKPDLGNLRNDEIVYDFLDTDIHSDRYYPRGTGYTTHYKATYTMSNGNYKVANLEMDEGEFKLFLCRRRLSFPLVDENKQPTKVIKWYSNSLPPNEEDERRKAECNKEVNYNGNSISRYEFEYTAWETITSDFFLINGKATSSPIEFMFAGAGNYIDLKGKQQSSSFMIKMNGIKVDLSRTINGVTTKSTEDIDVFISKLKVEYKEIDYSQNMKKLFERYMHTGKYLNYLQVNNKVQFFKMEEEVNMPVIHQFETVSVHVSDNRSFIDNSLGFDFLDETYHKDRYSPLGTGYSTHYKISYEMKGKNYKVANLEMDENEFKLFLCRRGIDFPLVDENGKSTRVIKWSTSSARLPDELINKRNSCDGKVPSAQNGVKIPRSEFEYQAFHDLASDYTLITGGMAKITLQGEFTLTENSSTNLNGKVVNSVRIVTMKVNDIQVDITETINGKDQPPKKEYIDVLISKFGKDYPAKLYSPKMKDLFERFTKSSKYLNYLAQKNGH